MINICCHRNCKSIITHTHTHTRARARAQVNYQ